MWKNCVMGSEMESHGNHKFQKGTRSVSECLISKVVSKSLAISLKKFG